MSKNYIFVIDTDQYAGNFERELAAYITGCVGECGVGKEEAKKFEEDLNGRYLFDNVLYKSDDGCARPVTIFPTPNWYNDGNGNHYRAGDKKSSKKKKYSAYLSVAIFFDSELSEEQIALMKERAIKYSKDRECKKSYVPNFNVTGFRLLTEETIQTEVQTWAVEVSD